jgi:hypothetical protein
VTDDQLSVLAERLAAVFGGVDDHITYVTDMALGGRRGYVVVARGDATTGDANAVLRNLQPPRTCWKRCRRRSTGTPITCP